ncbi:hypothetical protein AV545_02090 [Paenibacillus jamilae]|uniref:HNH endonuclease n=1 Tax=Paenibacillus jamilae TaxID=114136 RepID=UPI0007AB600D|nr:HNH endonuclease [Paenibacillus jamilae]KZE68561.1 hypothetical protein AV545_02090 [Paenibacillus jamilae]
MKKVFMSGKQKHIYALVDDEDYEMINSYKWYPKYRNSQEQNYAKTSRGEYMHRLIMKASGIDIINFEVDHINRRGLDNRKENLRLCSRVENERNVKKNNVSSGYHGIFKNNNKNKAESWQARIRDDKGKPFYIGSFNNLKAAINARNYYAKEFHGEFAIIEDVEYMSREDWEKHKTNLRSKITSGFVGVRKTKSEKWAAYIVDKNKRTICLGTYMRK